MSSQNYDEYREGFTGFAGSKMVGMAIAFGFLLGGCGVDPTPTHEEQEEPIGEASLAAGSYDVMNYVTPSCSSPGPQYTAQHTSARWYVPMGKDGAGRSRFVYVTSTNGADFLEYTADNSYIRLWRDTSWAYADNGQFCDEQCGVQGQPTSCKHQWNNDPATYAYDAPRDTGDGAGSKDFPRYIPADDLLRTYGPFNVSIDARNEATCGDCASWHQGSGCTIYTVQHLPSVTSPTAQTYYEVIKKIVLPSDPNRASCPYPIGAGEVFYYAKNIGWVGFELPGYQDWITGQTSGVSGPSQACAGLSQGSFCSASPYCSANCAGGGWWCTGDGACIVNGVAGHNYHCPGNNTAPDRDQACPIGCHIAPAGYPDYCNYGTFCGGGAWCGNDCVNGFSKTLYTFTAGGALSSVKQCQVGYANQTCVIAPPGSPDYCN